MPAKPDVVLHIEDVSIAGYAQPIMLRTYRCLGARMLPIVLYFHGGGFCAGSLCAADLAARAIATDTGAWVITVAYSLAPLFPFPAALEDGYLALLWAFANARGHGADKRCIGVAGHDAGGNVATGLASMARDRRLVTISAQALLAPLLDPGMTRFFFGGAPGMSDHDQRDLGEYARAYRAYLPNPLQRWHPYVAPLESHRLAGLPAAFIVTAELDPLRREAEEYAVALIAAGVPTEVVRHRTTTHDAMQSDPAVLADVADFFTRRLARARPLRPAPQTGFSQY